MSRAKASPRATFSVGGRGGLFGDTFIQAVYTHFRDSPGDAAVVIILVLAGGILGLRDSDRTDRGLEHNLRAYLAAYEAQSGVATSFVNELGGELVLAPRTEVHLIRVVQEALTNVLRHARAATCRVALRRGAEVRGVLRDAAGSPLAGVPVRAVQATPGTCVFDGTPPTVATVTASPAMPSLRRTVSAVRASSPPAQ